MWSYSSIGHLQSVTSVSVRFVCPYCTSKKRIGARSLWTTGREMPSRPQGSNYRPARWTRRCSTRLRHVYSSFPSFLARRHATADVRQAPCAQRGSDPWKPSRRVPSRQRRTQRHGFLKRALRLPKYSPRDTSWAQRWIATWRTHRLLTIERRRPCINGSFSKAPPLRPYLGRARSAPRRPHLPPSRTRDHLALAV